LERWFVKIGKNKVVAGKEPWENQYIGSFEHHMQTRNIIVSREL